VNLGGVLWTLGGTLSWGMVEFYNVSSNSWIVMSLPPNGASPLPASRFIVADVVSF